MLNALADSYPISSAIRSSDLAPRISASFARAIRQRARYSIGPHPSVPPKRAAKADLDIPANLASSETVHPTRTSDTPGIRTLDVSHVGYGIDAVFAEITELAPHCRSRDCSHDHEPGCAVQAAMAAGKMHPERLTRWRKLQNENYDNSANQVRPRGTSSVPRRKTGNEWSSATHLPTFSNHQPHDHIVSNLARLSHVCTCSVWRPQHSKTSCWVGFGKWLCKLVLPCRRTSCLRPHHIAIRPVDPAISPRWSSRALRGDIGSSDEVAGSEPTHSPQG